MYALGPGADVSYSDPAELMVLRERVEQLHRAGVTSYCLLFDDISNDLREDDEA